MSKKIKATINPVFSANTDYLSPPLLLQLHYLTEDSKNIVYQYAISLSLNSYARRNGVEFDLKTFMADKEVSD